MAYCLLCTVLALVGTTAVTATFNLVPAQASTGIHRASSSAKAVTRGHPIEAGSLIETALRQTSRVQQLGAKYTSAGAQLSGGSFQLDVGTVDVGRGSALQGLAPGVLHGSSRATYGSGSLTESYRATALGIEESFKVGRQFAGTGPLVLRVPITGLRAVGSGTSVDLEDSQGRVQVTYSGLRVTDATGATVPATMQAGSNGTGIAIDVRDGTARYPLTVDPTWSQVAELTSSDGTQNGGFGAPIAINGNEAIIGEPGMTINGNYAQGEAYIYTLTNGTWTQSASLVASNGVANSSFGSVVDVDGNVAFVGAPDLGTNTGAVYVFSLKGGAWTQVAELTISGSSNFGTSIAESGGTLVIGESEESTGGGTGTAIIYSGSGGNWLQVAQLYPSDGDQYGRLFGASVAMSAHTIVVGAPGHTVNGNINQGAVYVFTGGGSSWSQVGELYGADSGVGDTFGSKVALWQSTLLVGAPNHQSYEGAAYVFTANGTTFTQTAELTPSDGAASDRFGASVAISGAIAVIGSLDHTVGGNAQQGAAYVFAPNASSWLQTGEITASDGAAGDYFGNGVAMSGATALIGAPGHTVGTHSGQGAAYEFNLPLEVQPQGSPLSADEWAGGSLAEGCQCSGSGSSSQRLVADPIDPATGDVHETANDLTLPGSGLPLGFSRSYDAQAAQAQAAAGAPVPALGYGWAYNLGMSLSYNTTSQQATVTEENGAQVTFSPYVAGTSPAWCLSATNFCSSAPRVEATLNENTGGSWTYVRYTGGSQLTFAFSSSGALASESDQFGNTLVSASYAPVNGQTLCPSGDSCTAWASSSSGRELVLAFNSSGRLASVFDANSTLVATFAYTGTGCTTWNGSQVPDLCQAVDSGGVTYSFTYDSGNATGSFDYDMLTGTPPGATTVTSTVYDSSGRVTQQTDPSGAVTTLAYAGTNSTLLGGTTTVTVYPLGTGTGKPQEITNYEYSSNVLVGTVKSPGATTASSQVFERDPVSLLPLVNLDGNDNSAASTYQTYGGSGGTPVSSANVLTSTDGAGNTVQRAYNPSNQIWCSVDAADYLNGVRCPSSPPMSPPLPGTTDPNLGASITFYNTAGQVTATTDALGNTTADSYTSGVSGVPNGLRYCLVDPVDYQASVACPPYGASHVTGTTTATFDSAGDKTSSTDADGNTTSYAYAVTGHPGLVSSKTDPDGTVTVYTYNGAGEVTSQAATFGSYSATTTYAYDSHGRKYCEVDPYEAAQSVTCPSSPPSSPPTPSSDPYLGTTITTYDSDGRTVQVTNPIGGITYTAFDSAGEPFCAVAPYEAASGVTCPSTAPTSPPTIASDPYLGATITSYDTDGRVAQVTNPLGAITLNSYDAAGNIVQTTVESNNPTSAPNIVTAYTYDADNRVASTTVGSGSAAPATTLNSYDPNGNTFCSVTADAYAAGSSTYQCPLWQPSWITSPPTPSSLYSTTPTSSQANNVTTSFYNVDGNQLQSTNSDVETSVSVADGDGRTYCTSDPVNVSIWLSGHSGGTYPYLCPNVPPSTPPSTGSNPGYTTTIFDAAGRTLSTTDHAGDTTSTSYDPAGHPLTVTDPRGKVTSNCYYYENGAGQCAASAPAGGGSGDDLYSTITPATAADPSGQTTTTAYYPGDQPHSINSVSGTTTDAYDANSDLTSVTYSNTAGGYTTPSNVSYSYYPDGSRHTMVDGTGTTTYTEDAIGDVTQQQLSATGSGLKSNTVNYSYFTTGALASIAYPSYGTYTSPTVNYTYDALGNMGAVTDWLPNKVTFGHDGDGNLTSQKNAVSTTNPNGTSSTTYSYDGSDQNTQAASTLNCSGTNGALTQYFSGTNGSRNPDNQVTQYQAVYASPCSGATYQRNYNYDVAGRVIYQGATTQGANPNTFAYDASGDPTTISSHDSSNNFDTYTQAFDSAGEVNSQTPISGSHGVTSTYSYDSLGDRTQTVAGSTTTNYGFDQVGQMTSVSATTTATYQYSGAGLEAATSAPGTGWGPPSSIDSAKAINSVSCASSTFCFAVDANGNAVKYTGTWGTASSIDSAKAIDSVSCASSTFCFAVDANGNAVKYTGTWGTASSIDGTTSVASLSCPSSSFCEAVDTSGNALKYNGSTWSSSVIDRHKVLEAVSCPSATFCQAVDNAGDILRYNGSTWSSSNVDSTRTLKSVSCPTTTFCAAVDSSGYALTYNGTSWSSATDVDGTTALKSISCANSTSCQAVDAKGNALAYNASGWSYPASIDGTTALDSISCASSTFCQAVDAAGQGLAYGPMTVTSQLTWDSNGPLPLVLSDPSYDYIYGPTGQPVEQIALSTSAPTYLTYTPSNSTWISTNQAGVQTGYWGFDAYGSLAFGTPTSPFGYSGQYADATTGLVNDRARWFQPQSGSFTTRDPAFASTDTAYTYAGGDPVNQSDPTGQWEIPIVGWCIGHCDANSETPLPGYNKSYPGYSPFSLLKGGYGKPECGSTCGFVLDDVKQYWHDTFPDLRASSGAALTMLEFITSSYAAGTAPGEQLDPSDQGNCMTVQSCLSNVLLPELNPGENADDLLLVSKDDTLVWWGMQLSDNGVNVDRVAQFADALDTIENISEPLQAVGELGLAALAGYYTGLNGCSSPV